MNNINNQIIMMQGFTCDSNDAFDLYPARPMIMSHGLSYENIEQKCKCSHCGQWGKARSECSYCGAPIDE